ncbi:MAG: hypothetical protein AAF196_08075 [Planctomycetota bacterium]
MTRSSLRAKLLAGAAATVLAVTLTPAVEAQGPNFLFGPMSFNADLAELPSLTAFPATTNNTRTQIFYGASELGSPLFTATEIAFRYDGPLPPTSPGVDFPITQLTVRVGTTAVGSPRGSFGGNLTSPLTTIFDGATTIRIDESNAAPEPWSPSWTFPINPPLNVDLTGGGFFVVEFMIRGNSAAGAGHGSLDQARQPEGAFGGTAVVEGTGCSAGAGQPIAAIQPFGTRPFSGAYDVYAPGGAYSLNATGLGPNAPAALLIGFSDTFDPLFGNLPFQFTPQCALLQSIDAFLPAIANPMGTITAQTPGSFFSIPPRPALQGTTLFHQFLSFVPTVNPPFGLVATNRARITLGGLTQPPFPLWTVAHRADPDAAFATDIGPHALAMRITTL